jgi:DNA-binding phage protein
MKQKTTKPAPMPAPVDYLELVREKLNASPRSDFTRIAVDAGLSWRTIYAVLDTERDPRYSTVMALYRTLQKTPAVDRRRRA